MKNLLLFSLVIFGTTSCSKDSLDQNLDAFQQPDKSEIKVSVTYLHWTGQCENCCGTNGSESLSFIANAKVELYPGERNPSDASDSPLVQMTTNTEGTVIMKDIEPASYTIWVDTPYGKKSRSVSTQLHKRTSIDFSF